VFAVAAASTSTTSASTSAIGGSAIFLAGSPAANFSAGPALLDSKYDYK
jgi:hypothetical protein